MKFGIVAWNNIIGIPKRSNTGIGETLRSWDYFESIRKNFEKNLDKHFFKSIPKGLKHVKKHETGDAEFSPIASSMDWFSSREC